MHEIHRSWAANVGGDDYVDVETESVKKDLEQRIGTLFGGKYKFAIKVYQTAEEARIGSIYHVLLSITAPISGRVWDCDIVVGRENQAE